MFHVEHLENKLSEYKAEYENLCSAFEKAQIPFLPLKGSVIRKYYPEAWMRTSCDIDILVHDEDVGRAKEIQKAQKAIEAGQCAAEAVPEVKVDDAAPIKYMQDGQLFLRRDGQVYNMTGQRVQ